MPLIKHDGPAVSRAELADLSAALAEPFQYRLLERDEQRILFVRSPRAEPDPVSDLEACLEHLPDAAARDLDHAILLGAQGSLHVPGTVLRPLVERRAQLDRAAVARLRAGLDPAYGLGWHRVAGDPAGVERLGIRIPRSRCVDLNEPDLLGLARALGPNLEDGTVARSHVAYLIADEDHVRLTGAELAADLAPRWRELNVPSPPAPAQPLANPPSPPAPPAAVRTRPRRTIRVRPAVELEFTLDASPPAPAPEPVPVQSALEAIESQLRHHGFDVRANVAHGPQPFALAAERAAGFPRRVLVRTFPHFARTDAIDALRLVRELEADLLVALAPDADLDAIRRTVASKVKVLSPREVGELRI